MSTGARRRFRDELLVQGVGWVGSALLRTLYATCRQETRGEHHFKSWWKAGKPVIFVIWHGRLLTGAYVQRRNGLVALISRHRDGEYIARVVERWGFHTVRGSSTRGGSDALRGLLRNVRRGRSVVLTPDGPRGPRERMKLGALHIAQLSGAPIIPAATGASRAWWIEGWDRFQIPKPFSRIRVVYGEPLCVSRTAQPEELAASARELEQRLAALMEEVDALAA